MSIVGVKNGIIDNRQAVYGLLSPVCSFCKHWIEDGEQHCKAYKKPFSIPLVIWTGSNRHRKPFKGDNGIQFEPIEEEEAKSRVQESVETLRDELQKLFPESNVKLKREEV